MKRQDQPRRIASLIDHLLQRDFPSAVHLAIEPGCPPAAEGIGLLAAPRFSLCLSGSASYSVMRAGTLEKITLKRGEAIAVAPDCVMEPHPDGRYLALGMVFTSEMTRFLVAKKTLGRAKGSHRFLLAHHSASTMDEDIRHFFEMLFRPSGRPPEDPFLRRLLQFILIKAREMSDQETAEPTPARKAYFTWRAACHFIQENLGKPVGRVQVAGFLQIHPNHLSRLFTRFSGASFNHYLLDARLRQAAHLLKNPSLNISEIARACGFAEANYFIRCYRKKFGDPPGKARIR